MSQNKGLTLDGWSDNFLKKIDPTKRGSLLKDLWNPEVIDILIDVTIAKLVPLNKVWPEIPGEKDFRPVKVY
jgi:hypothetical protein